MRGVGKEEEGATGEGGVEDVHSCSAEDLFPDEDPEGDAEGDLPEGDGGGECEGEEHACDEEAFVDFVAVGDGEDDFDAAADGEGDEEYGEEVKAAVDDVGYETAWIMGEAEACEEPGLP